MDAPPGQEVKTAPTRDTRVDQVSATAGPLSRVRAQAQIGAPDDEWRREIWLSS